MATYAAHEFALLFPMHDGPSLYELRDDIKENGLLEDITLYQENGTPEILDGRRRDWCCDKTDTEKRFTTFNGSREQALKFVVSKNMKRRHLGEGERAIVAAKIATLKNGFNQHTSQNLDNLGLKNPANNGKNNEGGPIGPPSPTTAQAAEMMNVSEMSVKRAKKVLANGTPALQEAVTDGTVSVSDAAKVATEPPKVQDKAVEDVKKGKAKTAGAAVKTCKKREPKTKDEIQDAFGTVVPKNRRDAYADPWITDAVDLIAVISEKFRTARLIDGMNKRHKHYPFFNSKDFIDGCGMVINTLDQLLEHLKERRPACVCPSCEGNGCTDCSHSGLVYRELYKKLKEKKA